MKIIGLTGTIAAGKGEGVRYLVDKKHFAHFSARTFITQEVLRRGLPVNLDTLVDVANDLRRLHSPSYIAEQLFAQALVSSNPRCVIESLRTEGEVVSLRAKGNFCLWSIDARPEIRYERLVQRKSETDMISFEEFLAQEEKQMRSDDPNKQNLFRCIELADYRLLNNGTLDELYDTLEFFLKRDKY